MVGFLLWLLLLVLCAPLAIAALILYPIVWLLLLPFRLLGVAVGGVLALIWGICLLPLRLGQRLAKA
jgi:uncharacterized membrane protein YgaE (UPF0421/DUF939 family)